MLCAREASPRTDRPDRLVAMTHARQEAREIQFLQPARGARGHVP